MDMQSFMATEMNDQSDGGNDSRDIIKANNEAIPITTSPKPQRTAILTPIIAIFRRLPLPGKILIGSLGLGVIVAFIAALFSIPNSVMDWPIKWRELFKKPNEEMPAGPVVVDNLKQEIRTFLERVDPEVLKLVDAGQPEIKVMLSTVSESRLYSLAERQGFNKYMAARRTATWSLGSDNKFPGFINELGAAGAMSGYALYPKDALKR